MAKNVERRLTLKTEVAGLREVTTLEEKLKKINQLVTDTQAKTTRYHGTALTQANNLLKVYVGEAFNFTADETGYIGIHEEPDYNHMTFITTAINGMTLMAERIDGVVVGTISAA